jgi:uncharacterized protein with GYD domain
MASYIALIKWTDEGRKTVTDSLNRVERVRDVWKKFGAEMKAFYYVFGRYDMVAIVEAPSDAAVAKAVLSVERWGASRIETLKAFTEAEAAEIIKGLQ